MPGSFRFVPPQPPTDLLTRTRLLRSLVGRWDHRITSLVGGPGLGKTTLLSQAIAENRLAPRGDDIWVGLEPHDADADRFARGVASAVQPSDEEPGRDDESMPAPATVAGALWQRAPTDACLVLDDVHLIPPHSTSATWLKDLVAALPTNGHLVLASRADPPIPLTRYGAQGAVLHLAEEQLRFDDEELSGFAAARGLDIDQLREVGGWPAMAELTAAAWGSHQGRHVTGAYLWEEVLEPLGTMRRHVLAIVCDLGGADDELVSAAAGMPVDLATVLDGVPLLARGADGWYQPHALWRTAPGIELSAPERASVRRRAVEHLAASGRFDDAFRLAREAELWDMVQTVLHAACLASDRLIPGQLRRWLAQTPESVRSSTTGRLVDAMHTALTAPADAAEPLRQAAERCRADGDVDGELTAIAQLGRQAWWAQDVAALPALAVRVAELERTGHPTARALAGISRVIAADIAGDDATVLAEIQNVEPSVLDAAWEIMTHYVGGMVALDIGETSSVYASVDRLLPTADRTLRAILTAMRLRGRWQEGHVAELLRDYPAAVDTVRASGIPYYVVFTSSQSSLYFAHVGATVEARRLVDEAAATMARSGTDALVVYIAVARAALALAEGDETTATSLLSDAFDPEDFERGPERRLWRRSLPLSYVLLPSSRPLWDGLGLRGYLATCRDLSAVVVALRDGQGPAAFRQLEQLDVRIARAALPYRFAAELAAGLAEAGRAEGPALLEELGDAGRAALRKMMQDKHPCARGAKALLAAAPAPPPQRCYLAVLGPQLLVRGEADADADAVADPDLRRRRIQELVAYLVLHRKTTRAAVSAALWPDLDERAAANNLGVTLSHLTRVLEPSRHSGEPPYLLRSEGQMIRLVTGDHLHVDVDDFDHHLRAASQAEADGTPSLALDHYRAAVAIYRGELDAELTDVDWLALDREHYRSRFVGAAVRAGQLLLTRGDTDEAEKVSLRALEADQWSEDAYAVLVGAALFRGDRSGAHRLLQRCLAVLADLGIEPSASTQQLRRRVERS